MQIILGVRCTSGLTSKCHENLPIIWGEDTFLCSFGPKSVCGKRKKKLNQLPHTWAWCKMSPWTSMYRVECFSRCRGAQSLPTKRGKGARLYVIPCYTLFIIFRNHPGFSWIFGAKNNMCSYGDYGAHMCTSLTPTSPLQVTTWRSFLRATEFAPPAPPATGGMNWTGRLLVAERRCIQCLLMLKNIKTMFKKMLRYWRWAAPFSLFRSCLSFDTFVFLRFDDVFTTKQRRQARFLAAELEDAEQQWAPLRFGVLSWHELVFWRTLFQLTFFSIQSCRVFLRCCQQGLEPCIVKWPVTLSSSLCWSQSKHC